MINIENRSVQKGYGKMSTKGSICYFVYKLAPSLPLCLNQLSTPPTLPQTLHLFICLSEFFCILFLFF